MFRVLDGVFIFGNCNEFEVNVAGPNVCAMLIMTAATLHERKILLSVKMCLFCFSVVFLNAAILIIILEVIGF